MFISNATEKFRVCQSACMLHLHRLMKLPSGNSFILLPWSVLCTEFRENEAHSVRSAAKASCAMPNGVPCEFRTCKLMNFLNKFSWSSFMHVWTWICRQTSGTVFISLFSYLFCAHTFPNNTSKSTEINVNEFVSTNRYSRLWVLRWPFYPQRIVSELESKSSIKCQYSNFSIPCLSVSIPRQMNRQFFRKTESRTFTFSLYIRRLLRK